MQVLLYLFLGTSWTPRGDVDRRAYAQSRSYARSLMAHMKATWKEHGRMTIFIINDG